MEDFYSEFDRIKHRKFDGMIITGAPIEHFQFEKVEYWEEITIIMDWAEENVTSILHICWGAQAALYHHYGTINLPLRKNALVFFTIESLMVTETLSSCEDLTMSLSLPPLTTYKCLIRGDKCSGRVRAVSYFKRGRPISHDVQGW